MIILAVLAGTGLLVTGCVERRMSTTEIRRFRIRILEIVLS